MTTPERIRHRQRLLGFFIAAMGVAMLAQTWYFNHQDSQQSDCLASNFATLTRVLGIRSATTPRDTLLKKRATAASGYESAASGDIWRVYLKPAEYLNNHPGGELPPKRGLRIQQELVDAILHYGKVSARVEERRTRLIKKNAELDALRQSTPVPPFPEGTCKN